MWAARAARGTARSGHAQSNKDTEPSSPLEVSVLSPSVSPSSPTRSPAASWTHHSAAGQEQDVSVGSNSDDTLIYSGTGLRVLNVVEDSTISFASSFDLDGIDEIDRASVDSDELTALASRPSEQLDNQQQDPHQYLQPPKVPSASDSGLNPCFVAPDSPSTASFDDFSNTPGLHTADMSSIAFNHRPHQQQPGHRQDHATAHSSPMLYASVNSAYDSSQSSPRPRPSSRQRSAPHSPGVAHMTLASYLSSNISSPKTRSVSSGSLASFPTDLLSDISRADSVVDLTDDAASEFNTSESGGDTGGGSIHQHRRSHQRDHAGDGSANHHQHDLASSNNRDNELIMPMLSGPPSDIQESSPSQSGSDKQSVSPPRRRSKRMDKNKTPPAGTVVLPDAGQSPHYLIVGGTARQRSLLKNMLDQPSVKQEGSDSVEAVSDLLSAYERVERPFAALHQILRPGDDNASNTELLQNLLPSLLSQVSAISVCFLILDTSDGRSLAQHVSDQFPQIRMISEYAPLVPIIFDSEGDAHGTDCTSQLTQGTIDWLGRSKRGTLGSLRSKARPFRLEYLQDLLVTLAASDLQSAPVKAFLRYSSLHSAPPTRSLKAPEKEGTEAPSAQDDTPFPASLDSSMLADVSIPSSSHISSSIPTQTPTASDNMRPRPGVCFPLMLDPLHLPSLLRLVGLNLASSLQSLSCTMSNVLRYRKDSGPSPDEKLIQQLLAEQNMPLTPRPQPPVSSAHIQPFFGCARWRYAGANGDHGRYRRHEKSAPRRCCGLFVAGIIVSIALWFS